MENIQGNLSTILVALYAVLSPYIGEYVSQDVFLAIFGLLLVIWSAYHPNTFEFLGNAPTTEEEVVGEDDGC